MNYTEMIEFHDRLTSARISAKKFSVAAAVIGLVPIPVLDFLGFTLVIFIMSCVLYEKLGLNFKYKKAKFFIVSAILGASISVSGILLAALVKPVPIIGGMLSGVCIALIAGFVTIIYSRVFVHHSEAANRSE